MIVTGNIIRDEILNFKKNYQFTPGVLNILVLGGSQAAKSFGELLPKVFEQCKKENINHSVLTNPTEFEIKENHAYISVSDRILGAFLEQCRTRKFEPGVDIGFLSYNETPMKKFIYKGISVISTDFKELGTKAAEFITNDTSMQCYIPTKLIIRESL